MIRKGIITCIAGLLAMTAMASASAHHSFAAAYDMEKAITLVGKIVDVRLTNPHSHFFIEVEDGSGKLEQWKIEAGTPGAMIRNGYTAEGFRKGDTVTIRGFQARNNSSNGMLQEIETADGKVWGMFAPVQSGGR